MTETIMRGTKIRIYPNKRQTERMDLWRRRTISLWNLLLSIEGAAYSGERGYRRELRWRQKLVEIAHENYQRDLHVWLHGRTGKRAKKPGHILLEDYARAMATYDSELLAWKESVKAWKAAGQPGEKPKKPAEPKEPKEPQPPSDDFCAKILSGRDGTLYYPEPDESGEQPEKAYRPRLFIWKRELMALMAKLKQEPHTKWIGDLPSHAAQKVCADLEQAIVTMLRERKKRLSGAGGRNAGFPKFKKSRYAAGSVYLANTQLSVDIKKDLVKLPNGIGAVRCEWMKRPEKTRKDETGFNQAHADRKRRNEIFGKAKLLGGRLWREGEDWYLSCQWQVEKPPPLPLADNIAGVKIAAKVLVTTFDDKYGESLFLTPEIDERLVRRHKLAGRELARRMMAQKQREKALLARGKNGSRLRINRSAGFFEASARLARLEGIRRNRHDDFLHKTTTKIIRAHDALQVQKMDVARLMKKSNAKRLRRHKDAPPKPRSLKQVRQMLRNAAMARTRQMLAYKAADYGRDYQETDQLFPDVQRCFACHGVNAQFKDGRRVTRCIHCGERLVRNVNAAMNEFEVLEDRLEEAKSATARQLAMAGADEPNKQYGRGGIGSTKHGKGGHSGKSPKLRHAMKREAEGQVIKDRSRIADPSTSVNELFDKGRK